MAKTEKQDLRISKKVKDRLIAIARERSREGSHCSVAKVIIEAIEQYLDPDN